MSNVIQLGQDTELVILLDSKTQDARRREIDGIIIFTEYANGELTEDIVGQFSGQVKDRRNLIGALEEMIKALREVDTEEHDYD